MVTEPLLKFSISLSMTIKALLCLLFTSALFVSSCASSTSSRIAKNSKGTRINSVRTTAYTHSESDHIIYGARTAVGTPLKYGTVRSAADAAAAAKAGACFAVSPGYTRTVGQACRDHGLPLLPGVATGSEIMMAQEDGYTELKFFPAMQAGGPAMLKAWSGPFFDVKFCPTGGVTPGNALDFLSLPNVACVGGSWLVPADALAQGAGAAAHHLARRGGALCRPRRGDCACHWADPDGGSGCAFSGYA